MCKRSYISPKLPPHIQSVTEADSLFWRKKINEGKEHRGSKKHPKISGAYTHLVNGFLHPAADFAATGAE